MTTLLSPPPSIKPDTVRRLAARRKKDTGNAGEEAAKLHLETLGYSVLGTKVRVGRGEVDIIARDPLDDVLVFAEVKSRKQAHDDYCPELDLTPRKLRAMTRAARAWIADHDPGTGYRMDLICVVAQTVVNHVKELPWIDHD